MKAPGFLNSRSTFQDELKKRVNDYFSKNNISPNGNFALYLKAILFSIGFVITFTYLVFFTPPGWVAIICCIVLAGLTAGIGFNVMHDGAHGSFSKHSLINRIAANSLTFLGASTSLWKMKHNVIHHTFTNVDGIDDDIDAGPFLRLSPTQKRYWIHRFQHVYFIVLYSLLYLFWVLVQDFKKYFVGKIGEMPIKKFTLKDHIIFWSSKLFFAAFFIIIPIYTWGFLAFLIGFLVYTFVTGIIISIVFQLAHTVEDTEFPTANENNKLESSFAEHQLKTTANFATKNKLISWLVGGLNFQIEHHLFPKISHVHYPAISLIIKQTCLEYGLAYYEYPKMRQAIYSHALFLKRMGRGE